MSAAAPRGAGARPLAFSGVEGDVVTFWVERPCQALEAARSLGLSRAGVARALEGGSLRRAGAPDVPLRRGEGLRAGEALTLRLAAPEPAGPAGQGPVAIVWQDRFLLAADKPAGILVHPDGTGAAAARDTLQARVQGALVRQASAAGATPLACQAVQRLDVETTGLCLFSLCPEFQPALDAQVAGHGMRKTYLALVAGAFPKGETVIDRPIGRDRHDARRMRVSSSGKPSRTKVRRLALEGGRSLVLAELLSGRRHQIRVHLASMGFPIVGDALYGGARSAQGLMLHAWSEDVIHPVTGELLRLQTAWPERFGEPPEAARALLAGRAGRGAGAS